MHADLITAEAVPEQDTDTAEKDDDAGGHAHAEDLCIRTNYYLHLIPPPHCLYLSGGNTRSKKHGVLVKGKSLIRKL